jgi:hypothetical protein
MATLRLTLPFKRNLALEGISGRGDRDMVLIEERPRGYPEVARMDSS